MSLSTEENLDIVEQVLEKRIDELEIKILGPTKKLEAQDALPENSVIQNLAHANTLISSALSGRGNINALIERLSELESYESDFEPTHLNIDAKLEYLLAMEPEINEVAEALTQMKDLLPVLDSDRFKDLPEIEAKLNNLILKHIEISQENETVCTETREMISRYNHIITNISKTLVGLDAEITEIEKAAEPTKVID